MRAGSRRLVHEVAAGGHLASLTLGTVYFFDEYCAPCRIRSRSPRNVDPAQWPSTTTGAQFLNRSGGLPCSVTGAATVPSVIENRTPPFVDTIVPGAT